MNLIAIFVSGVATAFIAIWFRSYFLLMNEFIHPFEGVDFTSTCLSANIIVRKSLISNLDKAVSSFYHVTAFNRSMTLISDTAVNKSFEREAIMKSLENSSKLRANPEVAINIICLQPYTSDSRVSQDHKNHAITKNLLTIIEQIGKTIPLTVRQFDRYFSVVNSTDSRGYQQYAQVAESSFKRNCNTCQDDVFFVIITDDNVHQLSLVANQSLQFSGAYSAKGRMIFLNTNEAEEVDMAHENNNYHSIAFVQHLRQHLFINPISQHLLQDTQHPQSSGLYETEIAAEVASRVCYEYAWTMHWLQKMQKDACGYELWRLWRLTADQVDSLVSTFTKVRLIENIFQIWQEGNEKPHSDLSEILGEQDRMKLQDSLTTIHKIYTQFKPVQHAISLKLVGSPQWQMLFVIFAPFWLPVSVPLIKLTLSKKK